MLRVRLPSSSGDTSALDAQLRFCFEGSVDFDRVQVVDVIADRFQSDADDDFHHLRFSEPLIDEVILDVFTDVTSFQNEFASELHERVQFRVGPPTISKAIKALENYLGVTLLRRTTRGLSLTSEGQKLLFAGGNLIEQADVVLSSVRNDKRELQGQLRISVSLAFSRLILAPILNEFSDLHPGLRLSFHLSDGYVDLVENSIDLAIRVGEQGEPSRGERDGRPPRDA